MPTVTYAWQIILKNASSGDTKVPNEMRRGKLTMYRGAGLSGESIRTGL